MTIGSVDGQLHRFQQPGILTHNVCEVKRRMGAAEAVDQSLDLVQWIDEDNSTGYTFVVVFNRLSG